MQVATTAPEKFLSIACAECGISFSPQITRTKICPTCISKKNQISDGIPKQLLISWCKYCQRYCGPPWQLCKLESKELLALCLKKIRGLKRVKLVDASFIWTEEHSRRVKVQLTVQKTVNDSITLEQSFVVEFTVIYTQCDDCKKDFTPHTWKACIQLRQKSSNKKTFFFLEQLILRYNAHAKAIKITKRRDGLDFFFDAKNHAQRLLDFLRLAVPVRVKDSKELVSQDDNSNVYKYKYTWMVEIPGVCREDIVLLPKKLCKMHGGVNTLNVCYKVGSKLHFYDPVTLQKFQVSGVQYFNFQHDIVVIPFKGNQTKFLVNDIYGDAEMANTLNSTFANIQTKFAHVEVSPEGSQDNFCTITHMGHFLRHGDTVTGYLMASLNSAADLHDLDNQKYLPDVLVIRKHYERKKKRRRIWRLKRMQVEQAEEPPKKAKALELETANEEKDFENFMDELEQNKFMRKKINLFVDEDAPADAEQPDEEMVQLNELMKDLQMPAKKAPAQPPGPPEEGEIADFIRQLEQVKVHKEEELN